MQRHRPPSLKQPFLGDYTSMPTATAPAHNPSPAGSAGRTRLRAVAVLLLAVLLAVLAMGLTAGTAGAANTAPEPEKPLLGAVLEWGEDSAASFAERLGATPALLGHDISVPFRSSETTDIRQFLDQAASLGSHAMLTVKPTVPLEQIDHAAARSFAAEITRISAGFRGQVLVRFAPDMNGSWLDWGQQPAAYRSAFRAVAAEFKETNDAGTVMVWEPYLGGTTPLTGTATPPLPAAKALPCWTPTVTAPGTAPTGPTRPTIPETTRWNG